MPLLTVAIHVFPHLEDKIVDIVVKVANYTWKQGLVLKSNSLCHGISGNGYALHNCYMMFKWLSDNSLDAGDQRHYSEKAHKWHTRTWKFAAALYDDKVQVEPRFNDEGRKHTQKRPDYPYSLMEGVTGEICFLSDMLLDEDDKVKFPCFEI